MADVHMFDITVEREEANFDRACDEVKLLVDKEWDSHVDKHHQSTGVWISQVSVGITFRSYACAINWRDVVHSYVFSVVVTFE